MKTNVIKEHIRAELATLLADRIGKVASYDGELDDLLADAKKQGVYAGSACYVSYVGSRFSPAEGNGEVDETLQFNVTLLRASYTGETDKATVIDDVDSITDFLFSWNPPSPLERPFVAAVENTLDSKNLKVYEILLEINQTFDIWEVS